MPVEFSKGEAGKGQHEINLDYTTAVEMADRNSVYKLAAKEIAHFNGRSVSFMAKYDFNDTGSSCHIHSSLWTHRRRDGGVRRPPRPARHERDVPALPRRPDRHGPRVQPAVGAHDQQLQAVPAGLVGAHRRRLGHRQPHARLPQGRPRQGHPRRVPHPRQRRQQLLRLRRHASPVGCTASRTSCRSASRSSATATRRPTSRASRGTSSTRSTCGRTAPSPASASATTCTTTSSRWPRPSGRRSTTPSPTGSCAATGSASSSSRSVRPRTPTSTGRWSLSAAHRRRPRGCA